LSLRGLILKKFKTTIISEKDTVYVNKPDQTYPILVIIAANSKGKKLPSILPKNGATERNIYITNK
jgi:hypothetical protein